MIREPAVAGRFYPTDAGRCRSELDALLVSPSTVDGHPLGGIVPHAGWAFSGAVSGKVFAALAAQRSPDTVVVFGASHHARGRLAGAFAYGRWESPLGQVDIDARLVERICGHTNLIVEDVFAHDAEHSIEVQVPFIQRAFPGAKLVPLITPCVPEAVEIGETVARTLDSYGYDAVIIGTTDLTHYGPRYNFTPNGVGEDGFRWAREVNDRRVIDLMLGMNVEEVVQETTLNHNACGGGAVAATMAAVRRLGGDRAELLHHTTSREVVRDASATDAVGYAGIIFTCNEHAASD